MTRFIFTYILKNDYEPLSYRRLAISLDRIISDFVSTETFRFIFVSIKGLLLLVFPGHLDPYCHTGKIHFHCVAARHESIIKLFHFYKPYFYLNSCWPTRPAETISVSAEQLIKFLRFYHGCKYFCPCQSENCRCADGIKIKIIKTKIKIILANQTLKRLVAVAAGGFTVLIGCPGDSWNARPCPEGWFDFINFYELFEVLFCVPRAPHGSRGTLRDPRK